MMKTQSIIFGQFLNRLLLVAILVVPLGLQAKNPKDKAKSKPKTYFGDPSTLGNGEIRTYVTLDADGLPVSVGVKFDASFLEDLPTEPSDGTWDILDSEGEVVWHCCGHEVELSFHEDVAHLIPFRHFVLNWNPAGHFPPGIYDSPHFDFHFYTIDSETRKSIPAPTAETACMEGGVFSPVTCADFKFLTLPLPADQQPPSHTNVGAVEPGMGNHLLDFSSAEWNGIPFSHTWIFGTMGGGLSFWEPMITRDYLLWVKGLSPSDKKDTDDPNRGSINSEGSGASVSVPIIIPDAAPEAGFYPTSYKVRYQKPGKCFTVSLEDMVFLEASDGAE
jgi:hypothetical protein